MHSERWRGALLLIGGVGSGLATALMAISMNNVVALSAIFLVGVMTTWFMTLANTMMQEAVPDQLRGRVSGIYLMSASGVMSFGNLGAGYLAARFGSAPVLGWPALLFILLLVITAACDHRSGSLPRRHLPADFGGLEPAGAGE